jgi:hypothetical protein
MMLERSPRKARQTRNAFIQKAISVVLVGSVVFSACRGDTRVRKSSQTELETAMTIHSAQALLAQGGLALLLVAGLQPTFRTFGGTLKSEAQINQEMINLIKFWNSIARFCPADALQETNQSGDLKLEVDLTRCNGIGFSEFAGSVVYFPDANTKSSPPRIEQTFIFAQLKADVFDFKGRVAFTIYEQSKDPSDLEENVGLGINGQISSPAFSPVTLQSDGWVRIKYVKNTGRRLAESNYVQAVSFGQSADVRVTLGHLGAEYRAASEHTSPCPLSGGLTVTGDNLQLVTFADESTRLEGTSSRNISQYCLDWRSALIAPPASDAGP